MSEIEVGVGLDVSKALLDCAATSGQTISVANTQAGVEAVVAWCKEVAPTSVVLMCRIVS